jgi:hypothetical protein
VSLSFTSPFLSLFLLSFSLLSLFSLSISLSFLLPSLSFSLSLLPFLPLSLPLFLPLISFSQSLSSRCRFNIQLLFLSIFPSYLFLHLSFCLLSFL